jgi:hypothetical protein
MTHFSRVTAVSTTCMMILLKHSAQYPSPEMTTQNPYDGMALMTNESHKKVLVSGKGQPSVTVREGP